MSGLDATLTISSVLGDGSGRRAARETERARGEDAAGLRREQRHGAQPSWPSHGGIWFMYFATLAPQRSFIQRSIAEDALTPRPDS